MKYFTFKELKVGDFVFILDENEPINYKKSEIKSIKDDGFIVEYQIKGYDDFLFFHKHDAAFNKSISHEWYLGNDCLVFADIYSLMEYIQNKVNNFNKLLTDLKG